MPATISEAFTSPFHKFNSDYQEQTSSSSGGSTDIKNPSYQENYRVYNNNSNYDTQFTAPIQAQTQVPTQISYDQQTTNHKHVNVNVPLYSNHDINECDILVNRIMSCATCRRKLRSIMLDDHVKQETQQTGGFFNIPEIPGFIGNFIVGLALIFFIDRIVKIKLGR